MKYCFCCYCCCCFCCSCCCCLYGCMVAVDPTNLPSKFGLNQVRNSWDIDDIEFVVVVVGDGGGGWWSRAIFVSQPTFGLSWGWVGVVTICDMSLFHGKIWGKYVNSGEWFAQQLCDFASFTAEFPTAAAPGTLSADYLQIVTAEQSAKVKVTAAICRCITDHCIHFY